MKIAILKKSKGEIMKNVEQILLETKALLNGHFKLTSGKHSAKYIEKIKIIQRPDKVAILCKELSERFKDDEIDAVVGPAMGGIALAFEVAKNLQKDFVFAQRKNGEMMIRSGFDLSPKSKVIIIEDIVTTGGSVFEVIEALKKREVEVVGVGLIVDRTGGKIDFGVRTEALLSVVVEAWNSEDCPLCKDQIPLTTPGSSDKK